MRIKQTKLSIIKRSLLAIVPVFAFVGLAWAALGVGALAPGDAVTYTPVPFNRSEWTPDRSAPSGAITVDSFGGRSNVLSMGVDVNNRSTSSNSFYYTEGLKRNLGTTAVRADLYVDSTWETIPTRAGIWGVGTDGSEISAYPIIEYTSNNGGYTGWRVWNDQEPGGWTNVSATVNADGWNTLALEYNSITTVFDYVINGVNVGSSGAASSIGMSDVILNQYNYGLVNGTNYTVRWSNLESGVVADDGVAPVVALTNPLTGSVVSGVVDVRGTVTDANPDHYYLRISGSGVVVYSNTYYDSSSFTDMSLYSWDTKLVPDGDYMIRLSARDASGNKDGGSLVDVPVVVNNTTPYMREQCMEGGYKTFSGMNFRNQGACVSYVNHNDGSGNDDVRARSQR